MTVARGNSGHKLGCGRKLALLVTLACAIASNAAIATDATEPRDVTDNVRVKFSGFRLDHRSGQLVQGITVTNVSRGVLRGDLHLKIGGLDPTVAVHHPKMRKAMGGETLIEVIGASGPNKGLKPGEHVSTALKFDAQDAGRIRYQLRVFEE